MAIGKGLVIFLCVLGAGFVVLIGYATLRHYQSSDSRRNHENVLLENGQNQDEYMRAVRLRNQEDIARAHGYWNQR